MAELWQVMQELSAEPSPHGDRWESHAAALARKMARERVKEFRVSVDATGKYQYTINGFDAFAYLETHGNEYDAIHASPANSRVFPDGPD